MPTSGNAVVALHACGSASDDAIAAALALDAPFAISPCCLGKLAAGPAAAAAASAAMPRSAWLGAQLSSPSEFARLARAADRSETVATADGGDARAVAVSRASKTVLELDRLRWAVETDAGYTTRLLRMPNLRGYAKDDMLLGQKGRQS